MRVVPCKTSYCKTNFKWEGILQATVWEIETFFTISYTLFELFNDRKLFSCLFWFGDFSLLHIKDELMRPPEYNLAQSFDSQIEGWILSRSVRPFVKKKSNTLMIIMPLRQLLHRKAQKTSHCFIAYRNLKNGQKYVSMIKSRN